MRTFIVALILLGLSIAIITSCAVYITKTADELLTLIDEESDIYTMEEKWKRSRRLLTLSTDHDKIFKIDSMFESAILYHSAKNKQGYDHALMLIKGAISEIKDFESFSLSNII